MLSISITYRIEGIPLITRFKTEKIKKAQSVVFVEY